MPEVNPTVLRGLREAAADAGALIERCVDDAVAALQAAEGRAMGEQRQQLAELWRQLLQRRRGWSERFPPLLRTALEAEASGRQVAEAAPERPSGFASLSLVDDTEIARKIESSRLAQLLTSQLERPLAELDALMSSALGLDGIRPERNPLRPIVYAQALRELMAQDQPDPTWPPQWLRALAAPLAQQLEAVYRAQVQVLTQARVHAADYRVVTAVGGRSAGASAASGAPGRNSGPVPLAPAPRMPPGAAQAGAPLAAHSGFADLPAQGVDGERLRQFLLRGEAQAHRPLTPGFHAQARAELQALRERADTEAYDTRAAQKHMHLPAVERPQRRVDTDSPLPREVWGAYSDSRERAIVRGQLKTEAREAGQVLGLEVVRRLVNKVAEDPRLLAPVREAIVGLEPSLSRLAMVAPRFFSDEAHPGRLLVERVSERSFKFNDEFSVEFQGFLHPVVHSFARLNELQDLASAAPFHAALATLQAGWAAQDAMDEEAQGAVLAAMQHAERRHLEAERIAGDLRQREDLAAAPQAVQDFLLGTWALVVAHARLAPGQVGGVDPGGHLAVVTDLLWSIDRKQALHEPARAFALIPQLLLKLRSGLASLGQQPAESDTFFQQLELLHRPVLKLRARQRNRELAPAVPLRVVVDGGEGPPAEQPWMAPDELRVAGFEDTVPSNFAQLAPAVRPLHTPAEPLSDDEAEDIVAALRNGDWIDLFSRQQWRRARLVWTSGKGALFMFTSHGGQPHSMTRRSLQRLVRERLVRPVEVDAVVPRALASLEAAATRQPLAA